ncbi:MAG: DUF4405 domain-containing protein [Deltaproteobacteria bacterium]|nr:DUF4405 domain-containing protein [Deltaproteobacteria bacterium]
MKRTALNFWLDLVSLLVMLGLAFTGGLIHWVLPAETGRHIELSGLNRHDYGAIHFYLAVIAVVLLALHVLLHWSWICCVVGRALGRPNPSPTARAAWGLGLVAFVALLLGAGLWWASSGAEPTSATRGDGRGMHGEPGERRGIHRSEGGLGLGRRSEGRTPSNAPSDYDPPPGPDRALSPEHEETCAAGAAINGRTTLAEAARICRTGLAELKRELGLPAGTNAAEPLGRLRRLYGISLHDVRDLACR